jgi:hypothetical protein
MRVGFCSSPTSAAPGRPRARPHASAIAIGTIASRSVAGWPSRPSGGAWHSISGVVRAISAASTSVPSSSTCFAICGAPSICSGTVAPFIGAAKSVCSWPTIPGSTCITFRRTPQSSIQPNTCGRRLTENSPMRLPTISMISAISWKVRRGGCVAARASCGPASTRRTSRGPRSLPRAPHGRLRRRAARHTREVQRHQLLAGSTESILGATNREGGGRP